MAQLIPSEFSSAPNEKLIEETSSPQTTNISNSKLIASSTSIKITENTNQTSSTEQVYKQNSLLNFNDNNDLVFKPLNVDLSTNGQNTDSGRRTKIIEYTVRNGDTVSSIARRFSITINTILWANNLSARSLIRPGDTLTILPESGVLYTVKSGDTVSGIAQKYNVSIDKILSHNNISSGIKIKQKIIIPGGRKIIQRKIISRRSARHNGLSAIKNLIKSSPAKTSNQKMVWPTVGHRITQYYSWRHHAIDIANRIGTPIYAAADGVVIIAAYGWNGGYGNTIIIDHGNGIRTRYGHASKLFVKVGERVKKGENIAAMGSTGHSTGPHVHFEVIVNGVRRNPLNYVR